MTEWGVVGVIVVLIGLVSALVKPMLSLNSAIVRLTTKLDGIGTDISKLSSDNAKSHERIWQHNEDQDEKIEDHEKRIFVLERHKGSEG